MFGIVLPGMAEPSSLSALLRQFRTRIHPEARALGAYQRTPSRYGRRVTQEEVAEAAGVSRVWYATLESGAATRTSTDLLARIADVMMLDPAEREALFRLAVPELARVDLSGQSIELLDAFASLRNVSRKLWSASSEAEALAKASEELATLFREAAQAAVFQRANSVIWHASYLESYRYKERFSELWSEAASTWRAQDVDDMLLYPKLSQPGEQGMMRDQHSKRVTVAVEQLFERYGLGAYDILRVRIHSRRGLVGAFNITQPRDYVYSEFERAVLSALAELTSLALS